MATVTKIWTNKQGKKIPLPLIDNEYLKNIYIRLKEIDIADETIEKFKSHEEKRDKFSLGGLGGIIYEMHESPMTVAQVREWLPHIISELEKRKLKIPIVNRHTIEGKFKQKRFLKNLKMDANKKFDDKFKF